MCGGGDSAMEWSKCHVHSATTFTAAKHLSATEQSSSRLEEDYNPAQINTAAHEPSDFSLSPDHSLDLA